MESIKPELMRELQEIVSRAQSDIKALSKQPRFKTRNSDTEVSSFFNSVFKFTQQAELQEEPWEVDSRKRDTWLRNFWKQEPHLSGVLNSVVSIDKNRGWSLIGTEGQVEAYLDILHDAEDGRGWRYFMSKQSEAFYTADIGSVTEIGRDGKNGPLAALYAVDPARCKLQTNPKKPISYYPPKNKKQDWRPNDFFRVTSMPSTDEKMRGLGYCAVSRAVTLTQIMVAVYQHDKEQLGARAPQGLLLLNNVPEQQWLQAMKTREVALDGLQRKWFGGVAVIASGGLEQMDAKLIGLSQLPPNFDREMFINGLMFGYALCFGYDPSEFWPVAGGPFGRATEVNVQHRKATGKGALDFILNFQEQLQQELPDTILFQFEQRDDEGEMMKIQVEQAQADLVKSIYESGLSEGAPLVTLEEARSLLARNNVIPREWTEVVEEVEGTDGQGILTPASRSIRRIYTVSQIEKKRLRDELLSQAQVYRAINRFPNQPLVHYEWPSNTMKMYFERASDAKRPFLWTGASVSSKKTKRRKSFNGRLARKYGQPVRRAVLYEGDNDFTTITDEDVDAAIANAYDTEFAEILDNEAITDEEVAELEAES